MSSAEESTDEACMGMLSLSGEWNRSLAIFIETVLLL